MPKPVRITVFEPPGRLHASPTCGARRNGLDTRRLLFQPAAKDVTYGIGRNGSRAFAVGEILPAPSLATTNRPPATAVSIAAIWLAASVMFPLYSYRTPASSLRFGAIGHLS